SEDLAELMVQGTTVPMTGTSFEQEVLMAEGLNDVNLVATDLAGNIARFTFSVLRDTAPPVITLTAPAEGALLNATSVRVAGLMDEQVQGDRIVINGATATLSSGAFELLLSSLDEGPITIDVTAIDLAGNRASVSMVVIIDTLPPIMELVSPNDGLLTRQATVLLEGTSEEGAIITIQGVPVILTGTTFTHSVDLAEGRNIIHASSIDEAGNRNSTLLVVDRDSTPPMLQLYGLVDGTVDSEGDAAFVNGRTEHGVLLWMIVDGIPVEVPVFPDGSFLQPLTVDRLETAITMRAEDAAGNTASADVTVLRKEVQEPTVVPPPPPVDPVVTVAVVSMATIVAVGVAMTFEFTKYALILMVLPLYARIKKHEVLDNKTRLAIHGLVVENPGMHYNEIIREFDLTNGVAAYHLDVLEREGFVRSVRDGTLRRFYSSSTKVPGGHKATPDQMRERILEMVNTNPGINQKTIVDDLGIGRTLVGYHLKTLIDEGYIEAHKQGRFTVYSRTRKRWFRLN
ncbi:MAG: winged helix-turn-helix transcriptional regulator, partial [Thermoplasmata archaeon]|nr:winged helix-turn-helix transcriptional regulator [Thermoplasmata archaeon]